MYKFLIIAALVACASAKPGVVAPFAAPLAAPLAYANAPLYAAGGSSQVDVRHNYDGTQSSYTTAPFELTAPYSNRYVSGIPAAYAATPLAAPLASPYAAHLASPYAAPYTFGAPFASPYTAAPYAAPFAAPYAAPFAAPYSFAAPASVVA